jgi:hypothetical protein
VAPTGKLRVAQLDDNIRMPRSRTNNFIESFIDFDLCPIV